jgi:hypothetical protein
MGRKIKVVKEKESGQPVMFVVMDGNKEVAWDYSADGAMKAALETTLNERDNLRATLDKIKEFKDALRAFLS